jgi:hypothetical protein
VVKTIIRDSDNTQWSVLTKINYAEWSSMTKVKLEARLMWDAVRLDGVSGQEDRRAMEALCSAVQTEMVSALSGKETTKDAWDAITAAWVGSDRTRKSALQKLWEECDRLAFKPGEEIDDFALRLSSMRQRLEQYGDYEITEERAIAKFLDCSPKKYLHLKIAIQMMIDISTLTIEELTRWFKAVDDEEEMARESFPDCGKLYYATEHCQCHICRKKGSLHTDASVGRGSHTGRPRRVVALRAMHEEVSRRPPLMRVTTTMATSATTVAGLATLLGSATS